MSIDDQTFRRGDKTYRRVLLRTSFRVDGRGRHSTLASLSKCSEEEIAALKLALKYKGKPRELMVVPEEVSTRSRASPSVQMIPEPRDSGKALLAAAGVTLPEAIPCRNVKVATRKKRVSERRKY